LIRVASPGATDRRSDSEVEEGVAKLAESAVPLLSLLPLVNDADELKRVAALGKSASSMMGVGSPIAHRAEEVHPAIEMHAAEEVLPVVVVAKEAEHAVHVDAPVALE